MGSSDDNTTVVDSSLRYIVCGDNISVTLTYTKLCIECTEVSDYLQYINDTDILIDNTIVYIYQTKY